MWILSWPVYMAYLKIHPYFQGKTTIHCLPTTKTKKNKKLNINFLQKRPLAIRHYYFNEFYINSTIYLTSRNLENPENQLFLKLANFEFGALSSNEDEWANIE